MLNIIVYEDNVNYMDKNIISINKALANSDIDYRIYKFSNYSKQIDGIIHDKNVKKIYILDVEMPGVSGLEIASRIREDDWDSIIIFASAYERYQKDIFYTRLMVLDFICKYHGYENRLIDDIVHAVKIIYKQKMFVFKYNYVVYRIPYDSICYIEKESGIKRCIIHTQNNNNFYIVKSIEWLLKNMDGNFYRTHQSCIVNINNIKEVDMSSNIIVFKNGDSTCLLADKKKKDMIVYVGSDK